MKLIFLIVSLVSFGDSANILGLFLYPSVSHHILGSILLGNLAKRGHNVTYISPFESKANYPNFTHIVVDDILTVKQDHIQRNMKMDWTFLASFKRLKNMAFQNLFFESSKVQNFLKSDSKFDLMIHFFGMDATLALAHRYDVPVMVFSPFGGISIIDELVGNRAPIAFVPGAFVPYSDDMNFFQRLGNLLMDGLLVAGLHMIRSSANEAIRKYLPGSPGIEDIQNKIDIVLVNSHFSTETPRPYLPAMVQIGGYHLQEPDALPADLKKTLDEATNGVIYFSFGTNINVSYISEDKLNMIIRSLGQLPLKVLMKFDKDTLDNKPDNVEIHTWYPQRGILAHPNVKLFINHGGYGGCTESLYYGVPMICISVSFDQPKNCVDAESNGYAIHLPLNQLTAQTFDQAVEKVLHDEKFIAKAKFKSELYRDQEMNPMDRAAYWVNHVIKHKGAKHLRAKALDLAWYQYYLLDVMAFILSAVMVVVVTSYYFLRYIVSTICSLQVKIKTKVY